MECAPQLRSQDLAVATAPQHTGRPGHGSQGHRWPISFFAESYTSCVCTAVGSVSALFLQLHERKKKQTAAIYFESDSQKDSMGDMMVVQTIFSKRSDSFGDCSTHLVTIIGALQCKLPRNGAQTSNRSPTEYRPRTLYRIQPMFVPRWPLQ